MCVCSVFAKAHVCVCVCVQGGSADGVCRVVPGDGDVSAGAAVGQQRHDSLPLSVRRILLRSGIQASGRAETPHQPNAAPVTHDLM